MDRWHDCAEASGAVQGRASMARVPSDDGLRCRSPMADAAGSPAAMQNVSASGCVHWMGGDRSASCLSPGARERAIMGWYHGIMACARKPGWMKGYAT